MKILKYKLPTPIPVKSFLGILTTQEQVTQHHVGIVRQGEKLEAISLWFYPILKGKKVPNLYILDFRKNK